MRDVLHVSFGSPHSLLQHPSHHRRHALGPALFPALGVSHLQEGSPQRIGHEEADILSKQAICLLRLDLILSRHSVSYPYLSNGSYSTPLTRIMQALNVVVTRLGTYYMQDSGRVQAEFST